MAKTWVGGADEIAQVSQCEVTAYDASTTYTITVTGEDGSTVAISTAGVNDVDDTAAALRDAWNNSTSRLCTGITASGATAFVILTADVAGVPFSVASSKTGGTGTIGAFTATAANQGPNDYGCAGNWLEGAIPVANDDVLLTGAYSILYGLRQSGVELDDFKVSDGFTGQIGSPGAFLQIDMADSDVFEFAGQGQAWISVGSAAISPRILQTASVSNGESGLHLKGTALATVNILGGNVRIMNGSTVTADILVGESGTCLVEDGVTLTGCDISSSGVVTSKSAFAVGNCTGGVFTTEGSGTVTTLNVRSGVCYPNSSGTITNLNVDGGTCDMTKSNVARTVTNPSLDSGVLLYDPNFVTFSNPPTCGSKLSLTLAA